MIERYKVNQTIRKEGKVIGYPFYLTSPKLGQFIPSIPKGKSVHISASTNVGKSQFWRWYFLIAPFLVYKINPNAKFKPRFFIFLLEETYEQLYDSLVSAFIFIKFNKIVEPNKLSGLSEKIITDEELKLAEKIIPLVEELLALCYINDKIYNPTGIFKNARREILKYGKRYYTTLIPSDVIIDEEEYLKVKESGEFKFKEFKQSNEDEYFFLIVDNVNLLEKEVFEKVLLSKHETIWRWSSEYSHKQFQKNYNVICLDIIQQAADAEKQQFTMKGDNIIEKLKPSREGYANNKEIARNADIIIGLFAPTFYGVKEYGKTYDSDGFNLKKIGDHFRTAIILKNRIGRGFKEIPLFFNGAVNYFAELPLKLDPKEEELIIKGLYQKGFKKL